MSFMHKNSPVRLPYLRDGPHYRHNSFETSPNEEVPTTYPFKNKKYTKMLKNIVNETEHSYTEGKNPVPSYKARSSDDRDEFELPNLGGRKQSENLHVGNIGSGIFVPRNTAKISFQKNELTNWDIYKRPTHPFDKRIVEHFRKEQTAIMKDLSRNHLNNITAMNPTFSNGLLDTPNNKIGPSKGIGVLPGLELDSLKKNVTNNTTHNSALDYETPKNSNKATKLKFASMTPGYKPKKSEFDDKKYQINYEAILAIDERLYGILNNTSNSEELRKYIKGYIELSEKEDVIQIDVLFLDPRMRRNLKTYFMLERLSVFGLLLLVEEQEAAENNTTSLKNISQYIYSNFLNFVDTIISRVGQNTTNPNFDKLKQLRLKSLMEIEHKSMSLESINKLLLKIMRATLTAKKALESKLPLVELLLEKIEFGLVLNFQTQLKQIFEDLIVRNSVEVKVELKEDNKNEEVEMKGRQLKKVNSRLFYSPTIARTKFTNERKNFHLPPLNGDEQNEKPIYSLILDLDETLIHYEELGGKGRFYVRPYAETFLKEMSEHYELIIFTAAVQDYADTVLNILDPHKYIKHRLYRQHTIFKNTNGSFVKDLSRIGRDLTRSIIIDNSPENFRLQQDNGIEIISWYNDPYDSELLELMPFLKDLVIKQVDDVRKSVRKLNEKKKYKKK